MIEREKIKSCAENIVKCVKVSEDDCVYIRGGIYCQDLLDEVNLHVALTIIYYCSLYYK